MCIQYGVHPMFGAKLLNTSQINFDIHVTLRWKKLSFSVIILLVLIVLLISTLKMEVIFAVIFYRVKLLLHNMLRLIFLSGVV